MIADGLWNTLGHWGQIENAILNLGIDARDAMPDGGKLAIEAGNSMPDAEYARVHDDVQPGQYTMVGVTDTGTGIAPDLLECVFGPLVKPFSPQDLERAVTSVLNDGRHR